MAKFPAPVRHYLLKNISAVVRWLIISDIVAQSATALFSPIFALYIQQSIVAPDPTIVVGTATAIYLFVKSLSQIPIARVIDRIVGERDDFWVLIAGMVAASLVPLFYLIIHTPAQLYAVQFVYGLALAATFPSFMAIFTRHIDHGSEGTEWGVYYTLTDISSAAAAAIGGVLAASVGFGGVIVTFCGLTLVGTLLLIPIRSHLRRAR